MNPGTLAALAPARRWPTPSTRAACAIDGMLVTGEGGVTVEGRYPRGLVGRALLRRDLDWALLQQRDRGRRAVRAGVAVRAPLVDDAGGATSRRRRDRRRGGGDDDRARARHDRRRRPPFDARVRPRPRAPSRAAAALGDRRATFDGRRRRLSTRRRDARPARRLHRRRAGARRPDQRLPRAPVVGRRRRARAIRRRCVRGALARDPRLARPLRRRAARRAAGRPRSARRRRAPTRRSTGCCSPATPPASSIR